MKSSRSFAFVAINAFRPAAVDDKAGIGVVVTAVLLTAVFPALVFLGNFWVALAGLAFWGIGYATQDTLLKAIIASVLLEGRRNLAFGLFYIGYGGGWLIGSIATGLLYSYSIPFLIGFAVFTQLFSLPFFLWAATKTR